MKIGAISLLSKNVFKSKVKQIHQGNIDESVCDKIDNFEETKSNARLLGEGLYAKVYLLNGTKYAIKETLKDKSSKKANGDFSNEANALNMIPDSIAHSQKFVARVETMKNNYYLLSTYKAGLPPKYPDNPWDRSSFRSLFNVLFALDKAGIYHNDLNESNCLIEPNKNVNVIDYQFAQRFSIDNSNENAEEFKTPKFMMLSNAQMFESASLGFYLNKLSEHVSKNELRQLFKTYLEEKSIYSSNRAEYLKDTVYNSEKEEYETLQAKYLKNPSDNMVDLQALKLQILYSFRKAFSMADVNLSSKNNIASAVSGYLITANHAKNMIEKAQDMKKHTLDRNLKKYLDYEIKYAKFWQDKMLEEVKPNGDNTYSWVERNSRRDPRTEKKFISEYDDYYGWDERVIDIIPENENLEDKFRQAEDLQFGKIDDISSLILKSNPNRSKLSFSVDSTVSKIDDSGSKLKKQKEDYDINNLDNEIQARDFLFRKAQYFNYLNNILKAVDKRRYNSAICNGFMAKYISSLARLEYLRLPSKYTSDKSFQNKVYSLFDSNHVDEIIKNSTMLLSKSISTSTNNKLLSDINELDID